MLDPNWFYSSLAQAAAAIVGIVGGFLLTAVLRQRDHLRSHRHELMRDGRNISDSWKEVTDGRQRFAEWAHTHLKPENALTTSKPVPIVSVSGWSPGNVRCVLGQVDFEELSKLNDDNERLLKRFGKLGPLLTLPRRERIQGLATQAKLS